VPNYLLRKAGPRDSIYFDAYIIEYKPANTPLSILGTEATLAFTANMNGCTFGIGAQSTAANGVVVTHSRREASEYKSDARVDQNQPRAPATNASHHARNVRQSSFDFSLSADKCKMFTSEDQYD
jgi:hypothetical protein